MGEQPYEGWAEEHVERDLSKLMLQMKEDSDRWFGKGTSENMTLMVLGLVGESGEVADELKKVIRGSQPLELGVKKMEVEAIDVLIYLMQLFGMMGTDIPVAYAAKRAINEQRFGKRTIHESD